MFKIILRDRAIFDFGFLEEAKIEAYKIVKVSDFTKNI